jgi:hypothetical protein
MVVSPMLRGLFGLSTDAQTNTVTLAPQLPADWTHFSINNVHAGAAILNLRYSKNSSGIDLEIENTGTAEASVNFEPVFSPQANIDIPQINGHNVSAFGTFRGPEHQYAPYACRAPIGTTKVHLPVTAEFGVSYRPQLPQLGSASEQLRILSETWSADHNQVALAVSGAPRHVYKLAVWNAAEIKNVDGATLVREDANSGDTSSWLEVKIPEANPSGSDGETKITVHLAAHPDAHKKKSE